MIVFIFNVITLSLILLISILFVKDLVYEDRAKKINKLIPSPPGIPIFGNLLQIDPDDLPKTIEQLYFKYGSLYRLRLGGVETVVVSSSELINQIFIKNKLAQHRYIRLSRYFLKDKDLMYSNGDYHYQLRNAIMSEITIRKLNSNRVDIGKHILNMIEKMYESDNRVVENIPFIIKKVGINVLIEFVYGTQENEETSKIFIDTVARLFKTGGLFIYSDYSPLLLPLDLIKMSRENLISDYLFLRDYSQKVIKQYEEKLKQNVQYEGANDNDSKKPLVELYYDKYLKGEIKYESISYAAVDILVAGLDSTSNTLSFTIAALINNPQIQEKLYNEIKMNNTDNLLYSDHSKFPYTISVMNEAYRYYSIVPIAEPNICVEDIQVQVDDKNYTIAKGTQIIKNLRSIHLNKEYWGDDSLVFNPDRFYNRSNQTLNEKDVFAFGAGARNCPGKRFAECVFFTTLVLLVKNFKFVNPTNEPIDESGIVSLAMQVKEFNSILVKRTNE